MYEEGRTSQSGENHSEVDFPPRKDQPIDEEHRKYCWGLDGIKSLLRLRCLLETLGRGVRFVSVAWAGLVAAISQHRKRQYAALFSIGLPLP